MTIGSSPAREKLGKAIMEKGLVLEIFYAEPVLIYLPLLFSHPDSLLIPLTGRWSERRVVFGGVDAQYRPGALSLKTTEPMREALEAIDY